MNRNSGILHERSWRLEAALTPVPCAGGQALRWLKGGGRRFSDFWRVWERVGLGHAEMVQDHSGDTVAAFVRGGGGGALAGAAGERAGDDDLGGDHVGGGLLGGDLRAAAEADVDLRFWTRVHACALDVVVCREGEETEGVVQGRACSGDEEQFFDRAGAVFFSAVCDSGGAGIHGGQFDLELVTVRGMVS